MTPDEIKSIRLKLKESQTEFAKRFGGRYSTISDWETGKRKPRPMALRLLEELKKGVEQMSGVTLLHSKMGGK